MVAGSSLGALGTPLRGLGAVLGRPSTVLRARGPLLGPLWGHLGGAWEALGLVLGGSEGPWSYFFESFLSSREAFEAKTAKILKMLTCPTRI